MDKIESSQILIILILGTSGMLVFCFGALLFFKVYQKRVVSERLKQSLLEQEYNIKMLKASLDSQESERKRIAAELHDGLGAMLWATKLNLKATIRTLGLSESEDKSFSEVDKMMENSMESVREITWDLTPRSLDKLGLGSALSEQCNKLNFDSFISFRIEGVESWIPPSERLHIFRIGQELIHNAAKHSKASKIEVVLRWATDKLELSVIDNGIGFSVLNPPNDGFGLLTMKNRSKILEGELLIESSESTGTNTLLKIPLNPSWKKLM